MRRKIHEYESRPAVTGWAAAWGLKTVLLFSLATALHLGAATELRAQDGIQPDFKIGAQQYPDDDAVILLWQQDYTWTEDGTVRVRDHRWVKMLNSRAIRTFADPRIAYCDAEDKLTVRVARTHLPDGTILPVADYSYNLAGPDDVAGWPAYAAWRDQVLCFSGIVDGCVLELDYEIETKPGVVPWLESDLRLDDDYPIVHRVVTVRVPKEVQLHVKLDGAKLEEQTQPTTEGGLTMYRWAFKALPSSRAEPQSPRWEQRCGRLRFTTCAGAGEWADDILRRVELSSSKGGEAVKKFAESAVEGVPGARQRVAALQKKLGDAFNFINSPKAYRSFACRDASEVFKSNYGNPLESAALLIAALRAIGLDAAGATAVDAEAWDDSVPTTSAFAGVVVLLSVDGEALLLHPQLGIFDNPGAWGRHRLLGVDKSGKLLKMYVRSRAEAAPNAFDLAGKITIDKDGKATGEITLKLTGAFYDPAALETADAQRQFVKGMANRVFSGAILKSYSVTELSRDSLKAEATVVSEGTVEKVGDRFMLQLGDGPAFLQEFPLPINRSYRTTPVQLAGLVREHVDLLVEMPEGWTAPIVPKPLAEVKGVWGRLVQDVSVDGRTIKLRRDAALREQTIPAADFGTLRDAVSTLQAAAARTLVVGPAPAPAASAASEKR